MAYFLLFYAVILIKIGHKLLDKPLKQKGVWGDFNEFTNWRTWHKEQQIKEHRQLRSRRLSAKDPEVLSFTSYKNSIFLYIKAIFRNLSLLSPYQPCKWCKPPKSLVHPLFAIISLISLTMLFIFCCQKETYLLSYSLFFSLLLITIYTDMHFMLISRFVTIYLLPLPLLLSMFDMLPLTPNQVMIGALSGYLILAGISYTFSVIMKKQGMGQGDIDLLCFIGAFLGFGGWWISLLIASCIGSVVGLIYICMTGQGKQAKIPFGPFLALGAMIYTIWGAHLFALLFPV